MTRAMAKKNMSQRPKTRIDLAFERLRGKKEKALITFITAGDPDIRATKDIILALESAGADIIELGIPFSDPMADGPTIQAASERALKAGTHLPDVIALVREVRLKSQIPIVLFGYYNPIFSYGLQKFARDIKEAGADGVLIVDLPAEESDELKQELDKVGVDFIFLLTPTSDAGRMRLTAQKASGFIYYISVTGVTGARASLASSIPDYVKKVRRFTDLPVGVGFGISTPEQAKEVSRHADGVIVGSAIVNLIARHGNSEDLTAEVGQFVSGLKKAITG